MQAPRALLSVFCAFLILLPVAAQEPAVSPQAATILHQSLKALVGQSSISDVTLTGTARRIAGSDDESGTAILKATAQGASRIELNLPSGRHTETHNFGGDSPQGMWSGPNGTSHPIAYHNLLSEPAWFVPGIAIANRIANPASVIRHAGSETRDSVTVEHFTIVQRQSSPDAPALLQHLSQIEIYVDSSTFLPSALCFNAHPDNNAGLDIPVEIRYSDYRPVNSAAATGVMIPFHIQKFLNNSLVLDLQFQTANINSGLSATDFVVANL